MRPDKCIFLVCKKIADDEWYKGDVAYLAYTRTLFKRIEYSEGGGYMLALWRQIAWNEKGGPIKNFQMNEADVFYAMQRLKIKILDA